jgi:DNA-binding SARP family transcriptional activator/TolB-like protein
MIHLRVLGGIDLHATDSPGPRSLLGQPKRLAVLVYLALARPRGAQRRDVLLTRFWPESDTEHGRGALRLTLHNLRKALGEGVLLGRGDEGVGFAPGTLWCDALEFERALDEGRPADALALYGGELLAGFHLPGAPEWEHWVELERSRLEHRAVEAVRGLVEQADGADDLTEAVRWARRGLEVRPDDEALLQRLLVLLDATGDGAGALRAYEAFARRRESQGDAPLAETQAIARAVRQRTPVRLPERLTREPAHTAASAESSFAADAIGTTTVEDEARGIGEPSSETAGDERLSAAAAVLVARPAPHRTREARPPAVAVPPPPARGRRRTWALLAGVAALAAAGAALALRTRQADAALSPDRVAVLPFRVRGAPQAAYLSEGLVDLLSTRLNGAGDIHTVDPLALLGYAAREKLSTGDLEQGRQVARHFGAGSFVVGDVVEAGGRVQVTAARYDVQGRRMAEASSSTADEHQLFGVVDQLAIGLLAGGPATPERRLPQTAALTTRSLPALRAYLTGERWFRAGKFVLASEAFSEAADADSTFALALYRLSTSLDWVGQSYGSRSPGDVVRQALRHRDRLAPHDRMLLDARDAYWNGSAAEAEQLYRAVLASYPNDVEAWHELGEVVFHRGVWMGVPLTRARPDFQRVLELSPENESARIHLARIAAVEGRAGERDSLVAAVVQRHPSHARALELIAIQAFGARDTAARDEALDRLRALPYDAYWVNAWRVAGYTEDPAAGELLAASLGARAGDPRVRAISRTMGAHMLAAQGRWRAADSALARARADAPAYATQVRANLALLPARPLSAGEAAAIRDSLLRAPAPAADAVSDPIGNARRSCPSLCRVYLLGALAVRARDGVGSEQAIRALDAVRDTSPHVVELARYQAHALRARIAQRDGDPRLALALLEQGWPQRTLPRFSSYETYGHTAERMLRADLLRALGRDDEALAWYATVDEDLGAGIAWLAPSYLARAEIYDRRGDRAHAAWHYARFVDLWRNADPVSQPSVRQARERLAALRG